MAIQISGTTVINDSRELQNIATLDSTTTTTISNAVGVDVAQIKAYNEIDFQTELVKVQGNTVTFKGNNATPSDSYLSAQGFDGDGESKIQLQTIPYFGFTTGTFGTPSSVSTTQTEYNNSNGKLYDGGQYSRYDALNNVSSVRGSYAQYYQNTTSVTGTYTYTSRTVRGFYYSPFSDWHPGSITVEVYTGGSWTQYDSFSPSTTSPLWREFSTPVTATQMRWTATTAAPNGFVFYEMQFFGSIPASGKYVTTPNQSVTSAGSSVTAYVLVKGTNSGWTFQASRNNGSSYTSPSTTQSSQFGDYYIFTLTYDLSGQSNSNTLGMKITFPNDGSAQYNGCKIEG